MNKNWKLVNFCEIDKYAVKSYCAVHNVDGGINLGDITKINTSDMKDFTMMCGGSPCFVKGTKVITKTGYKNIEDIRVGDIVLTHQNRFMPVDRIGGTLKQNIYRLKAQGFLPIDCTEYHPFYCKKDRLSPPEKVKLKDIKNGYFVGSHINNEDINEYNLSDEDCWILGRYVADGHIRKSKRKDRKNSFQYQCILSIGNNKIDILKEKIKTRHFSCYPHGESVHRIVFSSMELVNFIIDKGFGRGAGNKCIPNFILNLPVDKLKSFFDGYIAGDGCEIEGKLQATTISKELAMALCLIVQKIYRVGCRIYYTKRPNQHTIRGRIVNQNNTYMIRFMKESEKQLWFIEDDIIWYPVKKIINLNKQEDVFNIEVREDHTYTANNMITYNCQDFSLAGNQKGSVWTCTDCGHEYNPLEVHWSKRNTCPKCNSENIVKTRSSLLVEYLRVLREKHPKFALYENVKNIVGKKFKSTFDLFIGELHEYGYNTYYKVLNAKNFGIPQNRERVYIFIVDKNLDNGKFEFPQPFDNGIRLKDVLEDEVEEKYYLSEKMVNGFIKHNSNHEAKGTGFIWKPRDKDEVASTLRANAALAPTDNTVIIQRAHGFNKGGQFDSCPSITTSAWQNNNFVQKNIQTCLLSKVGRQYEHETEEANTLLARDYKGFGNQPMNAVIENLEENIRIRKLTPKECWRLMGFSDNDFDSAHNAGVSNSQLYKQAGNSIVADVLLHIYNSIYDAMPYLFDDLTLTSLFSGIGAFEIALDRFFEQHKENFTQPQQK